MNERLLRLLFDGRSQWRDVDGTTHDGWPDPMPGARNIVLVPAEDVLLLDTARIAGSQRQLASALPYLVEEHLAAPVESQHVVEVGERDEERLHVACVARVRMDEWLSRLREGSVEPDVLLPESLALPWSDEHPTLLAEPDRCIVRLGRSQALAGTFDEIAALAEALQAPGAHACLVGEAQSPWPLQSSRPVAHALDALGAIDRRSNLLQGDYAPRRRTRALRRDWRQAAMVAGVALLLAALHPLLDRQMLSRQAQAQRAQMLALYQAAVPNATAVDDPARRLRSALAARGLERSDGAMSLLARVAPVIAADDRATLVSLEYREQRLELVVQTPGIGDLDALAQRLARAGVSMDIAGATPGTQGVQGRLRTRSAR